VPRRGRIIKRKILPEMVYNSTLVHKFINRIMLKGKKSQAERIVYGALDELQKKTNQDALVVFNKAIDNITPFLEVKPRRVGGATYQVPIEVTRERGQALAMKWLREVTRKRRGKAMVDKMAEELLEAYNGKGSTVKKREELHKVAEANKAFAHFRW